MEANENCLLNSGRLNPAVEPLLPAPKARKKMRSEESRRQADRPRGDSPFRAQARNKQIDKIKKHQRCFFILVRPRRLERLTYSFGGCHSIQLSYGRTEAQTLIR